MINRRLVQRFLSDGVGVDVYCAIVRTRLKKLENLAGVLAGTIPERIFEKRREKKKEERKGGKKEREKEGREEEKREDSIITSKHMTSMDIDTM